MSTPDAIASSYLDDVTLTIDNDPDLLAWVRVMALYTRTRYADESTEFQADSLWQTLIDRFTFMLTRAQEGGALGALLKQMLAHVDITDLGAYYLRDVDDYLAEMDAKANPE